MKGELLSKDFYCIMCEEYFSIRTSAGSASCPVCHSSDDVVPKGHMNYPNENR